MSHGTDADGRSDDRTGRDSATRYAEYAENAGSRHAIGCGSRLDSTMTEMMVGSREPRTTRLDGARVANEIVARLRREIEVAGRPYVRLAAVLVGADSAARAEARRKRTVAREACIAFALREFPADASQRAIEDALRTLAADASIDGIYIQSPLPATLDARGVIRHIPYAKDVDGVTEASIGALASGAGGGLVAPGARAVVRLLERHAIDIRGVRVAIVGPSSELALPLALLLSGRGYGASVTMVDAASSDLAAVCRSADLIVSAANVPGCIRAEHVSPGALIIDAGASRPGGTLMGDVDVSAQRITRAFAPARAGVGPVSIACLLENTWMAASAKRSPR